jgi:phage terminase large subunit-like protein
MENPRELKAKAIRLLQERAENKYKLLTDIDERLWKYYDDLLCNTSADPADEYDWHNIYEILGAARFLRKLEMYPFNKKKVQTVIRLREGEWRQDGKVWRHVSGGLKCPGTSVAQVYRWQPFQVFVLADVFGPMCWINTEIEAGTKPELLPTERERDGWIWDYRRLCTDFTYFGPRKTDKTGLAAFIQLVFFILEDDNAECYCAANAASQSALLFSRTRQLIAQLDNGQRIRSTQTVIDWKDAYKSIRNSSVRPLSAGGKTKDGMFAQLCCADEFGSAPYTNGKSDMLSLVNVIQSSMGPRREPLTFTTTTAGTITTGPFIDKLSALHRMLLNELEGVNDFESDRRSCLCLEPDEWEYDEEVILNKKSLRRKVNPMLGLIVQNSSYDGWISEARTDPTKMPELIAKYFNHYVTGKVSDWVKPDRIRQMQTKRRIEDCEDTDGWDVYCGMDFSQGNDLHAATYLAVRWNEEMQSLEYFADLDAWINEETLHSSSIRDLYEKWIAEGWLHVSEGGVFQPNLLTKRIRQLNDDYRINFRAFGYDAKLSHDPINELCAWLQTIGISDPSKIAVPVGQTNATFNQPVDRLTFLLKDTHTTLSFSPSPLWPWEFGNVALDQDLRMQNKKPIKRNGSDSCKVDNVQCLCMAFYLEEMFNT